MFSENNNKLCSSLPSAKPVACVILMSLVLFIDVSCSFLFFCVDDSAIIDGF
jgi:hypothetical protein